MVAAETISCSLYVETSEFVEIYDVVDIDVVADVGIDAVDIVVGVGAIGSDVVGVAVVCSEVIGLNVGLFVDGIKVVGLLVIVVGDNVVVVVNGVH